jgi:hypothetical protein
MKSGKKKKIIMKKAKSEEKVKVMVNFHEKQLEIFFSYQ